MTIRPATKDDLHGLIRIFAEENGFHAAMVPEFIKATDHLLTGDELTEMLDHPEQHLLVADSEGNIIGAALVSVDASDPEPWIQPRRFGYIEEVVVSEEYRGRGIGKRLLESINHWAKQQGLEEIELHVWQRNHRATAFYESLGYEITRHTMRKGLSDDAT